MVRSVRFSGTRQQACGFVFSAIASISGVAAISRLSGTVKFAASRAISSSLICRRSSRKCAVMLSAPASTATIAARSGSGCRPPRAFRSVATWSMLMPRRMGGGVVMAPLLACQHWAPAMPQMNLAPAAVLIGLHHGSH